MNPDSEHSGQVGSGYGVIVPGTESASELFDKKIRDDFPKNGPIRLCLHTYFQIKYFKCLVSLATVPCWTLKFFLV